MRAPSSRGSPPPAEASDPTAGLGGLRHRRPLCAPVRPPVACRPSPAVAARYSVHSAWPTRPYRGAPPGAVRPRTRAQRGRHVGASGRCIGARGLFGGSGVRHPSLAPQRGPRRERSSQTGRVGGQQSGLCTRTPPSRGGVRACGPQSHQADLPSGTRCGPAWAITGKQCWRCGVIRERACRALVLAHA